MSLQTDLLCREGCGFYGNPEWNWRCSKCWREHLRKAGSPTRPTPTKIGVQPSRSTSLLSGHNKTPSLSSSATSSPRRSFLTPQESFSKVEDKKKRQNLKQIFQGRTFGSLKDSPEKLRPRPKSNSFAASDKKQRPENPPEVRQISREFSTYLKQRLSLTGVSDISKQVKELVDKLNKSAGTPPFVTAASQNYIDEISAIVQEFYQSLQRRLETIDVYKDLNEDEIRKILDFSESYVVLCCYKLLFCPPYTTDEEKDLELQNKIRSLNWITTNELKCPLNESSQEVRDLFNESIHDILEVDGKMTPQEKLECVVRCSKKVFAMLKVSNETPASADDFLPCLIYICIKANPPRIQSNINFITRFCNENKLRMGEGGYFFANLCCAVSFIENMTADSINMNADEFDSYISGRAVPPGSWHSAMMTCEGLQVMSQNVKTLIQIKARLIAAQDLALKLQDDMSAFSIEIEKEVEATLKRTPFVIRSFKSPISVDSDLNDDLDTMKSLPPPLVPQAVPLFDLSESSPMRDARCRDVSFEGDMNLSLNNTSLMLEDFLSVSQSIGDNSSVLSLDLSGAHSNSCDDDRYDRMSLDHSMASLPAYIGFSAQSFSIPSIACESDFKHITKEPSPQESPVASPVTTSSMTGETSSDAEVNPAKYRFSSSADSTSDVSEATSSSPIVTATSFHPSSSTSSSEMSIKSPDD